jgi:N-methylhydantoinase A
MDIARELNIPKVIVPLLPAHFSALGMLMTDVKHDYVRTYYKSLIEADFGELKRIYDELASAGRDVLQKEGVEETSTRIQAFFDLRYIGQEFFLTVPVSRQEIYSGERETVRGSFDQLHDLRYSHKATEEPIEIVNVRLTAYGLRPKISFPEKSTTREDEVLKGYREVFFDDPKVPLKCPIHDREALPAGHVVEGPAVIEEYASTTPLSRGDTATVSASGEIIITVGGVG